MHAFVCVLAHMYTQSCLYMLEVNATHLPQSGSTFLLRFSHLLGLEIMNLARQAIQQALDPLAFELQTQIPTPEYLGDWR